MQKDTQEDMSKDKLIESLESNLEKKLEVDLQGNPENGSIKELTEGTDSIVVEEQPAEESITEIPRTLESITQEYLSRESQSDGTQTQSQGEMPFALIAGEAVSDVPKDLYIPPDALEVFLEAFEGPLDLLLYLIKRQNLDILNIPIAHITEQYMEYVELMKGVNLELAAEYLVMAAMLAEIKSRVLLPRPKLDEDENDPRADLIRRLQEYERFKKAAIDVDELPRMGRDIFQVEVQTPELHINKPVPQVDMRDVMMALKDVMQRAKMFTSHQIQREALSTREKMSKVLAILSADNFTDFVSLFDVEEGKAGIIVTFLAIMELTKESLVELVQSEAFAPIHVRARIN